MLPYLCGLITFSILSYNQYVLVSFQSLSNHSKECSAKDQKVAKRRKSFSTCTEAVWWYFVYTKMRFLKNYISKNFKTKIAIYTAILYLLYLSVSEFLNCLSYLITLQLADGTGYELGVQSQRNITQLLYFCTLKQEILKYGRDGVR